MYRLQVDNCGDFVKTTVLKAKVLGNWDLLDQVIRSYNDEKAKAQQLPYETEDEFKKRLIITQVNRIKKLKSLKEKNNI